MAYDNLLSAYKTDREGWTEEKSALEDELRELRIISAETERRLQGQVAAMQAKVQASKQQLTQLEDEHKELQVTTEVDISGFKERIQDLQQTVAQLEGEGQRLREELTTAQADASIKDEALQRAADLERALRAMQQRAQQLLTDLEEGRNFAAERAEALAADLGATRGALAAQVAARAAADHAALALAAEKQRLEAALELERLINEPLRHTHYATTATMNHIMRSPVAPTVRDRAANPQQQPASPSAQWQPHSSGYAASAQAGPTYSASAGSQHWAGSEQPGAAYSPSPSSAAAHVPAGSFSFSPVRAAEGAPSSSSRPDISGLVRGKALTRLARSWATTTAAAGHPHPAFLDNVNSAISPPPPPPGPTRAGAAATTASSSHPARPRTAPGRRPGSAATSGSFGVGSGGGGGAVWSTVPTFRSPQPSAAKRDYVVPRHLTDAPRSSSAVAPPYCPGAPAQAPQYHQGASMGMMWPAAGPASAAVVPSAVAASTPWTPGWERSAQAASAASASTASTPQRPSAAAEAPRSSGRAAMRALVKQDSHGGSLGGGGGAGGASPALSWDTPVTIAYA